MSDVIGVRPKVSDYLNSLDNLKTFFFGSPMPLRYRITGIGKIDNAADTYKKRVNKIWGNAFGQWASTSVLIHFFTPYILTLIVLILWFNKHLIYRCLFQQV